ncbi:MAG: hypothetical protein M3541_05555 [Acidobacteriota bacterium]|nr:hypothetical protein [Acidobacteriota bacterium]
MAALAMTIALAAPAAVQAQTSVTSGDIQRLQDEVYQASSDLSRLRSSDTSTASSLQGELDELREEVIYLKVKLRKEGNVPRADYTGLRDRLATLRSRATGDLRGGDTSADRRGTWTPGQSGSTSGVSGGTQGGTYGGVSGGTQTGQTGTSTRGSQTGSTAIPAGQEIDVRLQMPLNSATAQVEDRFEATTIVDLFRGDEVLIPAGSVMRGVVRTVDRATRTDRKGQLTVSFDQVTVRGRTYPMRGTVTEAIESSGMKGEAGRIGAGAGVGAIIGGILGGVKGALLGVLIGGGGTIAATEGQDVTLDAGTILRLRLDTPPAIR